MKIILFLLIIQLHSHVLANDCIINRAAFDIGSGTTRIKVATINRCTKKIIKSLFEKRDKVAYKDDLTNADFFASATIKKGLQLLRDYKEAAQKYHPESYVAVATSAFRDAKNGPAVLKKIQNELKIKVTTITQKEEALVGHAGATSTAEESEENVVVWDIGGGSSQIITKNDAGFEIYLGDMAAVSFKNLIITDIQKKDLKKTSTPNPISYPHLKEATQKAKALAKAKVPANLRKKLRSKKVKVIGIGGVHYYSIKGQAAPNSEKYTLNQLAKQLKLRSGLKDQQIDSNYPDTEISNLALVLGFMQGLAINEVYVKKVNMTDGLLVRPDLIFH